MISGTSSAVFAWISMHVTSLLALDNSRHCLSPLTISCVLRCGYHTYITTRAYSSRVCTVWESSDNICTFKEGMLDSFVPLWHVFIWSAYLWTIKPVQLVLISHVLTFPCVLVAAFKCLASHVVPAQGELRSFFLFLLVLMFSCAYADVISMSISMDGRLGLCLLNTSKQLHHLCNSLCKYLL